MSSINTKPIMHQVTDCRYPEVLRFQFDDVVNDPLFGSANNLAGEIPFLQPTRRLIEYEAFVSKHPEVAENICCDIVSKYRNLWRDETDDEVFEIVRRQVAVSLVVLGEFPNEKQRDCMTKIFVLGGGADNLTEKYGLDLLDEIGEYDYAEIIGRWRSSSVLPLDDIPSGVTELNELLKLGKVAQQEMEQVLPDHQDLYPSIRDDVIAMCTTHVLLFEMDRQKNEPRLSEETMKELRVHLSGMRVLMDMIAILKGIRISPEIRRDDLFQMTLNRAGDIFVVVNAVLGLPKDIRRREVDSPITCSVVHDKVPFQEAFDGAMKQIYRLYNDFVFVNRKLAQLYRNEPNVQCHVKYLDWLVDSLLYIYKMKNERYGVDHQVEIVKKEHSD